jgi:HEAT repeat protein
MKRIPKVIPPRSRVRLVRADKQTPSWNKHLGRQFRIGYYSRKDGLDCIWLVNENGKYEQTTDRDFISKYFQIESVSQEKNFYGVGKRSLTKIRLRNAVDRLNGRSSVDAFGGAQELFEKDDLDSLRSVINTLRRGKRVLNRTAAAYAMNLMHAKPAILALEKSVGNQREHPRVRGQAAESLAHNHRENSHRLILKNLMDPSKEVRFWCAYALAEMGDGDAVVNLRKLARKDRRIVRGFWSVSREARAAIRKIQDEMRDRRKRHSRRCLYCSKAWSKRPNA